MPLNRRQFIAATASASLLPISALAATPLRVVATTSMIADAAMAIAGNEAEVFSLMGPGVDPHGYRQTRSDIAAMVRADLMLWNGLYLEAQLEEFLHKLSKRTPTRAVGEAIPKDQLISHEDYAGRSDPHVWMNPDLWAIVVRDILEALITAKPESASIFTANHDAYQAQITEVSTFAKAALAQVPAQARVLISAHDAFGYFGRAHGYEVMGIQGMSTESEAGLQRIKEMVDLLVARDIRAVFVESSVSDRNIRALIEGAAAQGHRITIGGELFSDAMGQPGTYEGTYIGMIDHNATTIAQALGANVPLGGMSGKLNMGS